MKGGTPGNPHPTPPDPPVPVEVGPGKIPPTFPAGAHTASSSNPPPQQPNTASRPRSSKTAGRKPHALSKNCGLPHQARIALTMDSRYLTYGSSNIKNQSEALCQALRDDVRQPQLRHAEADAESAAARHHEPRRDGEPTHGVRQQKRGPERQHERTDRQRPASTGPETAFLWPAAASATSSFCTASTTTSAGYPSLGRPAGALRPGLAAAGT